MSTHVSNLCKSASFALKRIGNIRQYLDQPSTEKLVQAFVSSKLDYCNSLLYGLPDKEINHLWNHLTDPIALQHSCSSQTYNYVTTLADKR